MYQRTPHPQVPSEAVSGIHHSPSHREARLNLGSVPSDSSSVRTLLIQGDAFRYAHSFSIEHPLIAEQINIDTKSLSSALPWLCAHTMQGVEFSSAARDPPPRCYRGTRKSLINQVQRWLENPLSQARILCLNGAAGVGKSAVLQSLAECIIADKRRSGASIFLDMSPSALDAPLAHYEPSKLWTTISYRLATYQPSYALRVQQEIARDPKLVEQSMAHQFRSLIAEPIGRDRLLSESPYLVPIFIDGLDRYHKPHTQEQIIHTILGFVQAYPDAPLAWLIALRPERRILRAFAPYTDLAESITTIDLTIDSADACEDVQRFLRGEFGRIQDLHDVGYPWPREEEFCRLFIAAAGFFIFAYAIICFCDNSDVENPEAQLKIVLSTCCEEVPPVNDILKMDPLYPVHAMYRYILQNVPSHQYRTTKRILGFLLLPNGFGSWTSDSITFWSLCNILGIQSSEAYACLSRLTSVLAIPARDDAARLPLRVLHKSFAQYLAHEAISKEFWIDVRMVVADLWHCHLRALTEANASAGLLPDPSEIKITWDLVSNEGRTSSNFRIKFWENARRLFFHHLLPCPSHICPSGPHYDALSDLQKPSLLLDVFEQIDFDKLLDGYAFPDVPYRFIAFLDWLVQLNEDHPLRREGFIDLIDASQGWAGDSDPNLSGFAFRIYVEHYDNDGYIITFNSYTNHELPVPVGIDRSRLFSVREPPGSFIDLLEELDLHQQAISINVMGKCRITVDDSTPGQKFYYILPSKAGSSSQRPKKT